MNDYEMLTSNYAAWYSRREEKINLAFESSRRLRSFLPKTQQASRRSCFDIQRVMMNERLENRKITKRDEERKRKRNNSRDREANSKRSKRSGLEMDWLLGTRRGP